MNSRTFLCILCAFVISACTTQTPAVTEIPVFPSHVFAFTVSNLLDLERPDEIVSAHLELPVSVLDTASADTFSLFRVSEAGRVEILSQRADQVMELSADGSSSGKLTILFQDSFQPLESKDYEIHFGVPPQISVPDLVVEKFDNQGPGDLIHINNGKYDFYLGHELEPLDKDYNGKLPKDLYIRMESEQGWTKSIPLVHLYFNIPEFRKKLTTSECEPIFVISPGFPTNVDVAANASFATITLTYQGSRQGACPKKWIFHEPEPTDLYEAQAVITIYRDLPRVSADVSVTIKQRFYNHSGFALGSVETELVRPLVIFGDEQHTLLHGTLCADIQETTDRTEFMQVEKSGYIFRRAANSDGFAPFETIAQSQTFNDYYVVEGENGRAALGYFPEFQALANRDTREVGQELNMITAGPSVPIMPANAIIFSQTHLGGLTDLWEEIKPGTYHYTLTTLFELPFGEEYAEYYDQLAQGLALPLTVNLIPAETP